MPPVGAQVAQSVEQGTENPRVGSSILSLGTTFPDDFPDIVFKIITEVDKFWFSLPKAALIK